MSILSETLLFMQSVREQKSDTFSTRKRLVDELVNEFNIELEKVEDNTTDPISINNTKTHNTNSSKEKLSMKSNVQYKSRNYSQVSNNKASNDVIDACVKKIATTIKDKDKDKHKHNHKQTQSKKVNDIISKNTNSLTDTDTIKQLEHELTEKIDRPDKADLLNEIPVNRLFVERKRDKKGRAENEQYLKTYNEIVKDHDVQIKVTQTFVRAFLKGIVNDIKACNKEKVPKCINIDNIVKSIADSLPKNIDQDGFYMYVAEYLIAKSSQHYYYDMMAARIAIKRLHNITTDDFLLTAQLLQENLDKNNDRSPILADDIFDTITRHHVRLQEAIKYDRDHLFDYFGVKTLERSYLYKLHFTKFKIIERPQHLFMRVSLGIHGEDIDSAIETYDLMSQKFFTHATPTLFNSGTRRAQMSSCFLQSVDDNIESIFDAVKDIALTSKHSGGIGVHLPLRCKDSLIRGTNGLSSGVVPLCILLNKLAKYINQGGKRNGSVACYLEPHHADIFDFCDLRKNTGNDDNRARDLFLALWVSSLFMKRVKEDEI